MVAGLLHLPIAPPPIPKTRADCLPGGSNEARPCPHSQCRWHLATDVNRKRPHELKDTCALDVVDRGPATTDDLVQLTGLSRQRVMQLVWQGLKKFRARLQILSGHAWDDYEAPSNVSGLGESGEQKGTQLGTAEYGHQDRPAMFDWHHARMFDHGAFDEEVAEDVFYRYMADSERPYRKPCMVDVACLKDEGHEGVCRVSDAVTRERQRRG